MYCSSNLERRVSVRSSTFLFAQRRGTPEATCSAAMGISELIQQPFNKQKMYDVNDPQSTRSVTEIWLLHCRHQPDQQQHQPDQYHQPHLQLNAPTLRLFVLQTSFPYWYHHYGNIKMLLGMMLILLSYYFLQMAKTISNQYLHKESYWTRTWYCQKACTWSMRPSKRHSTPHMRRSNANRSQTRSIAISSERFDSGHL